MRAEYVRAILAIWACEEGHVLDHAKRGTLTVLNMLMPLMASLRAMSCGVEMISRLRGYDELYNENMQGRPYRQARFVA